MIPVTVSVKKSIIDTPTKIEIEPKDRLLETNDLAKSLSKVNGFTMARKGGAGSEIYYRAGSASRFPIFTDNSLIQGGCGGRMDTPLTYINPTAYRSIKIVKGPQDVRYGALMNGGVLFQKDTIRLDKTTMKADASVLFGSNKRFESNVDLVGGNELGSLQIIGGTYKSDDYRDGAGRKVHSEYDHKNVSFVGTLTPTETTALKIGGEFGEGEAAYADRPMDASRFDRRSWTVDLEQLLGEHKITVSAFTHDIDHVMDNFTLRKNTKGPYSRKNPTREIYGGKIEGELNFDDVTTYIGTSYSKDKHNYRDGMSKKSSDDAYDISTSKNFIKDAQFEYTSFYTQVEKITNDNGIFGGARLDHVKTEKYNNMSGIKQGEKDDNPVSGFLRYEHYIDNINSVCWLRTRTKSR